MFFLVLFLVMVIPLAEGALLALFLREVYLRHPLPLGGAIVPEWWTIPKPPVSHAESVEYTEFDEIQKTPVESGESAEPVSAETSESEAGLDVPAAEVLPPAGVSPFDEAANIPKDLPVHETIEAMTSANAADLPEEFERLIGESATAENVHAVEGNWDHEDLQALVDALPVQKIDFSQDIEEDSHVSEPISPTAKEVLGENFDFQALEQQSKESTEGEPLTADPGEPPLPSSSVDSAEIMLDVREDESGTVQVSSPYMLNVASQFASDFAVPQTVFPTFSNDMLQETNSTAESMTEDIAQFFFSEESRPMFTRKTKKQPAASHESRERSATE